VQPTVFQRLLSSTAPSLLVLSLFLCAGSVVARAEDESRVVLREQFSQRHREELVNRLRLISGWRDLKFDERGALLLGSVVIGGSPSARALLTRAVHGNSVIVLEDASKRPDVVFCSVSPGSWPRPSPSQPLVYIVFIDFDDFLQVTGDKPARESFDVGWGVLHEFDHVVNDSIDPDLPGHPGECENHINAMRREVRLPERTDYFFASAPFNSDANFTTRFVRLAFDGQDESGNKKKRYWLVWDASIVGTLDNQARIALGR